MSKQEFRTEKDSMGELQVPQNALYGAQTQRAIDNFPISGLAMPREFIRALGQIKAACARANIDLGLMDENIANAIIAAAQQVSDGEVDSHFPVDVFQTGSGTSSNMNTNEVISHLAANAGVDVHPNDHVNMGQSSNDVIPTAIHVSACIGIHENLLPALKHLASTLRSKAEQVKQYVKTGRTHLMDAMPVTLAQELNAWATQVENGSVRIENALKFLQELAQGGTAVGTGINAHPDFADKFVGHLSTSTGIQFSTKPDKFEGLSTQDAAVEMSGQLKTVAVSMMKMANDLRWMNSGPLAGLGEIALPALQPGSSIMPGKVNPVIPEATAMVCAQVIGNDSTITIGGQAGNFQLNVMLPVIGYNLVQSINLLANSARLMADKAIAGFTVNEDALTDALSRNPILVTALNSVIGYEKGAAVAKKAYAEGLTVIESALELTDLSEEELKKLLDPAQLTKGGIQGL
jgi:fumarate hydratase class II